MKHVTLPGGEVVPSMGQGTWKMGERAERRSDEIASLRAGVELGSLRRTTVSLVYKKTGNLRACQLLLGHRKLESTVRYLGIEVDDALELSEQIDL